MSFKQLGEILKEPYFERYRQPNLMKLDEMPSSLSDQPTQLLASWNPPFQKHKARFERIQELRKELIKLRTQWTQASNHYDRWIIEKKGKEAKAQLTRELGYYKAYLKHNTPADEFTKTVIEELI